MSPTLATSLCFLSGLLTAHLLHVLTQSSWSRNMSANHLPISNIHREAAKQSDAIRDALRRAGASALLGDQAGYSAWLAAARRAAARMEQVLGGGEEG